jgi:hypothetical protein
LFDGENISFGACLVIYAYINSTNILPIMIINGIYDKKNEMGWACGAYGGGERCAQGFGGED